MLKNELDKEQKMLELGLEWGGPRLKDWGNHRSGNIRPYIVVSQGLEVPGVGVTGAGWGWKFPNNRTRLRQPLEGAWGREGKTSSPLKAGSKFKGPCSFCPRTAPRATGLGPGNCLCYH